MGRVSVEGAEVLYIAGFNPKHYFDFTRGLLSSKEKFDELIKDIGEEPREGLHLVVSLTDESAERMDRVGFITSVLDSNPY